MSQIFASSKFLLKIQYNTTVADASMPWEDKICNTNVM